MKNFLVRAPCPATSNGRGREGRTIVRRASQWIGSSSDARFAVGLGPQVGVHFQHLGGHRRNDIEEVRDKIATNANPDQDIHPVGAKRIRIALTMAVTLRAHRLRATITAAPTNFSHSVQ